MNCETARELMENGQDAPITPRQEVELLAHLSTCADCARAKADYGALAKWLTLLDEDAPEEFSTAWRKAIRHKKRVMPLPYRIMTYAAAAVALLFVVGMVSRSFAPMVYSGEKSEPTRFHVAGAAADEPAVRGSGELFGGQGAVGAAPFEMYSETESLPAPASMPEVAMDSAAGAQEAPAPVPMPEAELDDSVPVPKADIPAEKELRRASSSIIPAYEIALGAQDHTALMEYISQLRENNSGGDLRYHQQTDSAGRVDFFQMNFTMSELAALNDWLNARNLTYKVYMPPETLDTEFVSFVLTEIPAASP